MKLKSPKKKVTRKSLIKKLDRLFAAKIRSQGVCTFKGIDHIACGGKLQCMHVISRKYHILRWDERNAFAGCQAHHFYYTHNPWEWQELIKKNWPEVYNYINKKRNEVWDKDLGKVELLMMGGEV